MHAPNVIRIIVRLLLANRSALIAENLALRQQLAVLGRSAKRPRLRQRDPVFWVWISKLWKGWRSALVVVQPDTVVRWHRRGFQLYSRWKSRARGRPKVLREIRNLIRRMSQENALRGAPRIQTELALRSVIGSFRRECLNHVIVMSESHLRRILRGYVN